MSSTPRRTTPFFAASTTVVLALVLALSLPALGWSQSAPMAPVPRSTAKVRVSAEPPARVAGSFGVAPMASLTEARTGAADQLAALESWNRAGRLPLRIGILRPVPLPRTVTFGPALAAEAAGLHAGGAFVRAGAGSTVWGGAVTVADAYRLRLHLADVHLPAGARLWVYGDDGETVGPFGPELASQGGLWTPSVAGPTIRLEVEVDGAALQAGAGYRFTVDRIGQIFRLDARGAPILTPAPQAVDSSCLEDVSCVTPATFPVVQQAEKAIAHLEFVPDSGGLAACTGGLLNVADGAPPGTPLPFLTANHCISTQAEASSLDAFWDYKTTSCGGALPPVASLPRTSGSTLLATGTDSDFSLLQLDSLPAGRVALGWDASQVTQPSGMVLHRISHPVPDLDILPQQYTRYQVRSGGDRQLCGIGFFPNQDTDDPTLFIHSFYLEGGTFGGSSGAPLMKGNGQVVGQLFGACAPEGGDPNDGCATENDELDGNFANTYGYIAQYLGAAPPPPGQWLTTPEQPGFEFQVRITNDSGPVTGAAEPGCIVETFCASGALAGRPEVFVKLIGPRPNGYLWVQISRFTPSEVEVWVRQVSSGDVRYYDLAAVSATSDDVSGRQDRMAFSP